MTQTFQLPGNSTSANAAIASMLPAALEALRSCFSGSAAPTSPVASSARARSAAR